MARSRTNKALLQSPGTVRVFISWSGTASKTVASALRDWLPTVIQALDPWLSASDIGKGARWRTEIDGQLAVANFGIVCLTRENVKAPWIHFEAGALAKALKGNPPLFTYLVGLQHADIQGPLAEFQHTLASKQDTLELLKSLNRTVHDVTGRSLPEKSVELLFEKFWPTLEPTIKAAIGEPPKGDVRPPEDMLREILDLVRSLQKRALPAVGPNLSELLGIGSNGGANTLQVVGGKYGSYGFDPLSPQPANIYSVDAAGRIQVGPSNILSTDVGKKKRKKKEEED